MLKNEVLGLGQRVGLVGDEKEEDGLVNDGREVERIAICYCGWGGVILTPFLWFVPIGFALPWMSSGGGDSSWAGLRYFWNVVI